MTNNNEEPVQKIKKDSMSKHNGECHSPKNNSTPLLLLSIITAIIALGAIAVATYTFFLNKQLQQQLAKTHIQFANELKQVDQKQEQTTAKTNAIEPLKSQFQTQFNALNNRLNRALNQRLYQNHDWLLLKARYYLELAQINEHWSTHLDATLALLEQADQLLKQVTDPQIFTIRQAIADNITQIKSIHPVDIVGLLSQLDAVQNSIQDLGIPLPHPEQSMPISVKTPPTNTSWENHIQETMNALSKLIIIRRNDHEVKPLLSPLLEAAVKENLHLSIQEAQWAVLNQNPFVYQFVLKQAIAMLKKNFNESSQNTASLIKQLTKLQQMTITQKNPPLGSALDMLNELIENKKSSLHPQMKPEQGGNPS